MIYTTDPELSPIPLLTKVFVIHVCTRKIMSCEFNVARHVPGGSNFVVVAVAVFVVAVVVVGVVVVGVVVVVVLVVGVVVVGVVVVGVAVVVGDVVVVGAAFAKI